MNNLSSMLTFLVNKIGNTAMGTTATTVTGAIAELLTKSTTNKNNITDYYIRVDVPCGESTCEVGTGSVDKYVDISTNIPSGYKAVDVHCTLTQSNEFYVWKCDFNNAAHTQVNLKLQKRSGVGGTIYPWISVICVRDLT